MYTPHTRTAVHYYDALFHAPGVVVSSDVVGSTVVVVGSPVVVSAVVVGWMVVCSVVVSSVAEVVSKIAEHYKR